MPTLRSILGDFRADAFEVFANENLYWDDGKPDPTFEAIDNRCVMVTYADGSKGPVCWDDDGDCWDFPGDGGNYAEGYAYACGYRD